MAARFRKPWPIVLGISAPDEYLYDWPELGTAALDESTLTRLGADVRARPGPAAPGA